MVKVTFKTLKDRVVSVWFADPDEALGYVGHILTDVKGFIKIEEFEEVDQ